MSSPPIDAASLSEDEKKFQVADTAAVPVNTVSASKEENGTEASFGDPEAQRSGNKFGGKVIKSRLPASIEKKLAFLDKFGVESRGIERVAEEDRDPAMRKRTWMAGEVWLAANCVVPTFGKALGYDAPPGGPLWGHKTLNLEPCVVS
jgi:hypothetical protein